MQYALDVQKISDLKEVPAPAGYSWWLVDGIRYEWRSGAPCVRVTTDRGASVPDERLLLDSPTKAAAKRAIFCDLKR